MHQLIMGDAEYVLPLPILTAFTDSKKQSMVVPVEIETPLCWLTGLSKAKVTLY